MISDEIFENVKKEPLEIRHQDLKRADDSLFRSHCPSCLEGVLLMIRDQISFKIQPYDNCLRCGRRFIYTDIEESVNLEYKKDDSTS